MKNRSLYILYWNRKAYISNSLGKLACFANFLNVEKTTIKKTERGITWNIPSVELAPEWMPVPIIDEGIIEYKNG